jgi:signal peptidase II
LKKFIGIALGIVALDQLTKWLVVRGMELHQQIPVLGSFFSLYSHRNRGAAFGILQNQRVFFVIVTIGIVIALLVYLQKTVAERKVWLSVALSLVLGGALGNFIDRALFGEVVDFIHLYFSFAHYDFPNFNVADSAICIGVTMLLLDALFDRRKTA